MINKEEKFKQIVSENDIRIRRICRYYASGEDESKDIYQEVLINIWKSLDSYRGDAAISTWIYRIALNTALTQSGKSYKEIKLHVDVDTQSLSGILDDEELENKQLLEKQLDLLQTEINQLSIIDKALISLQIEKLSTKEIANIIGLTEPNVRVKLHRIKETLRNSMAIKNGETINKL